MLRAFPQLVAGLGLLVAVGCAPDMHLVSPLMPEQRHIDIPDISALPKAQIPDVPPPPTVADPQPQLKERYLTLNEAIRIGLANSKVVRILAGVTATASGQTIYDPAITNTTIDQEQAAFDPVLDVENRWERVNTLTPILDAFVPRRALITDLVSDNYDLKASLSKKNLTGGVATVSFADTLSHFEPGVFPLNPQNVHATTLQYTQPLLQGAGVAVNMVPIVVARLNTERSFFQLKDSMQESVRGIVEAYWNLVFARTDEWARRQQVKQGEESYERAKARKEKGFATAGEVAQTLTALANFRATLIAAQGNVLQREDALRNILGLPPSDGTHLIPISPPALLRLDINWGEIMRLAEEHRPDLIELKLIIEADQQLVLQANNQAMPKLDATALYRWNGLEGTTPSGAHVGTRGDLYGDWMVGVNFSLPLGLRKERAVLRQQQLIVARDWANLDQGLHAAVHDLSTSTRNVALYYSEYRAYKEAREAARINLDEQLENYKTGRTIFLNVLQAITDWGNAVSAEAQAVTLYNTELATLERQTGTILETHGVHFFEERFGAIGPLGRLAHPQPYPSAMAPGPNTDVYPSMNQPAENTFDLKSPVTPAKLRPPE